MTHDDRRSRVLTARQLPAGCDVGVGEQLEGDEAIVLRSLRVIKNLAQLGEMTGPKQVGDIVEGLGGQQLQGLGAHLQNLAAVDLTDGDMLRCAVEPPVFGGVVSVLEDGLVDELGHGGLHDTGAHTAQRAWMISHP